MLDQPFLESVHGKDCVALDDVVIVYALSLSDYQAFTNTVKMSDKYGRGVIKRLKILQKISFMSKLGDEDIDTLVDAMEISNFEAGDQIMVQGDVGHKLSFILRGGAKVFVRSANTEAALNPTRHNVMDIPGVAGHHDYTIPGSVPVASLREGNFFGEQALIQLDCTRNASIVAVSSMICMTLHRHHMMEHSVEEGDAAGTHMIHGARSLSFFLSHFLISCIHSLGQSHSKSENALSMSTISNAFNANVGRGNKSVRKNALKILRDIAGAIVHSSYANVYTAFYKRLCDDPILILKFPDLQSKVRLVDPSSDLFNLQNFMEDILKCNPEDRSNSNIELLDYVLDTSVPFKKRFCQGWPAREIKMLWKSSKFIEYDSMMSIYEKDAQAVHAYILLTGAVRTMHYSHSRTDDKEPKDLDKSVEHLPKEIIGDEAILGLPTRKASAKALVKCSLLAINKKDFFRLSGEKHTVEDRVLLLSTFPIFQDLEAGKLHRLASKCQGGEFSRGQLVLAQGKCAPAMYFVKSGRLVRKRRSKKRSKMITSISEREFFGESCCLSQQSKRNVREMFDVIAESQKVEVLVLPRELCRKFDKETFDVVKETFMLRQQWYKERLGHMNGTPAVTGTPGNRVRSHPATSSKEKVGYVGQSNPEDQRVKSLKLNMPSSTMKWNEPQSNTFTKSKTVPILACSPPPKKDMLRVDMRTSATTTSFTSLNLKTHLENKTGPSTGKSSGQHHAAYASTYPMRSPIHSSKKNDSHSEALTLDLLQKMVQQDVYMAHPWRLQSPKEVDQHVKIKMEKDSKKNSMRLDLKLLIDSSRPRSAPPTLKVGTREWESSPPPRASPMNIMGGSTQPATLWATSPSSREQRKRATSFSNTSPQQGHIHPSSPLSAGLAPSTRIQVCNPFSDSVFH
jgi:CRP-like cAMP-binding protein